MKSLHTDTLTIVLAGGAGSRLAPLTAERAKPAVPFGGQYRIIDFTLSNCLHSGMRQVLVLTQYKSDSLHRHLRDAWAIFNPGLNEYITAIPPQLRTGDSWYQGTADAIFQNMHLLRQSYAENVLILSGDHIYRMDYSKMVAFHQNSKADVTVACMDVGLQEASSFGVMSVDAKGKLRDFTEKPAVPCSMPDKPNRALVSMGIHIFSKDVLCNELENDNESGDSSHDFGKDLLPRLIETHNVWSYRFGEARICESVEQYWRDVGTIDALYSANMDLLRDDAPLDLYCGCWPIRKHEPQSPPARIECDAGGRSGAVADSMISSGVVVSGGSVSHSVLSSNVRIDSRAVVDGCILFNEVNVGKGVRLQKCIVDKAVRIPDGESIGIDANQDARRFSVTPDGVVVVPMGYSFNVQRPSARTEDQVVEKLLLSGS